MINQFKVCSKCNLEKDIACFAKHKNNKDNLDTRCKDCIKYARDLRKRLKKESPPTSEFCECCGKSSNKPLCLDHDHITEEFRGWLCEACNLGIGRLGDDIAGVTRALEYLSRFYRRKVNG